jgi:hypothetical protein
MDKKLKQLNNYTKVDVTRNRGSGHNINRENKDVLLKTLRNELDAWSKIGNEIDHTDGCLILNKEKTQDDDSMVNYNIAFDPEHELAGVLDQHLLNVFSGMKTEPGKAKLFVML